MTLLYIRHSVITDSIHRPVPTELLVLELKVSEPL
jgi:hypothetical protein